MLYLTRPSQWFMAVAMLLILPTCSKKRTDVQSIADVNPYVFAYTSGTISKTAPIRIELAQDVVAADQIGSAAAKKWLSLSPAVSGSLTWENRRTLFFQPDQSLKSSTTYEADLDLGDLFAEATKENKTFHFEFRTRDQYLQVDIEGLQAVQLNDLSKQELLGTAFTADQASEANVASCLSAKQGNRNLSIRWNHSADGREHTFFIEGIERTDNPQSVTVNWNGNPIGSGVKESRTIQVPPLGEFSLQSAEVVARDGQHLQLRFSDPIDSEQNLDGLITVDGYDGNFRFLTDNNTIKAYPANSINGVVQVRISENIRNIAGTRLGTTANRTVEFAEIRPQVRLVGEGVIMPETEGLLFPFEAIGLRKVVVEIFKVYNNNVLQFLQSNQLNGSSNMQQVGTIIRTEEVDLVQLNPDASGTRWTRYALDLKDLVARDDKAIYSIRIGFRPEHAVTECAAQAASRISFREDYGYYNDGMDPNGQRSIMDSWYGIMGYYDDYSYQNREDPCFPEYYNADRFVSRNVVASNLGLIAKMGTTNEVTTIVTDLRSGKSVSGATVRVFDYQQQPIGQATSNGDGIAKIALDRKPFMLVVQSNDQTGYLRLVENESLPLSRFDVGGEETQEGLKGFLYAERGVWRPGDSVFLEFILDDSANPLPAQYPIQFEVVNARGQRHLERTVVEQVGKMYPLHFTTPPDAPTGSWRAIVEAGGATFERTLRIETVKPNRLEIDLDVGAEQIIGQNPISVDLEAKWLMGSPASGLKARVEAQLIPTRTNFDNYSTYSFDDPARRYQQNEAQVLFDNMLNGSGRATFTWDLPSDNSAPGMMRAALRSRVFERGGDFSTDSYSVPYSPYRVYAGVEIPRNKYQEPRLEVDEEGTLQIVTVDPQGRPVGSRSVSARMYKVDWRWWWDDGYDNMRRFNTGSNYSPVASTRLVTNAQGQAQWTLTPDDWGRYFVRICDEESGHCTGDFLYAGYPWYGDDNSVQRQQAAMLNFSADQDAYEVGDQVTLTIPSGQAGRALVTIENGSGVVKSFWQASTEGENTITFTTTPDMSPNVYAHVALIQPHQQVDNDLPIRMYGVLPIMVEDPATVLEPRIAMPDELRPEGTFTVEVSEANREAMSYTLAIVDEGLLGLTRFQTPDPHGHFYAKEALGVRTWDLYDQVLGATGGDLSNILSVGGDGAVDPAAAKPDANRFEPVVRHLGPFELKKGKTNKHEITMPNYVGAVRTMVVARSGKAYGKAEKRVPVTSPLMVLATLPRVLSPGETLDLPVNVFVNDPRITNVTVDVSDASNLVSLPEGASQRISFRGAGNQLASIPLQVGNRTGIARIRIQASGNGQEASQDIEIAVRNPNPYQTRSVATVVDGGETWSPEFTPIGTVTTRQAYLEVSNIPPMNLGKRINQLLRYPYGCVEQTVSAAFPQLFADRLLDLTDEQKQGIPERIQAAVQRLQSFQGADGGLAYWPGGTNANTWGTTYAGHFMVAAREAGYRIPPSLLNDWKRFQQKASREWQPTAPNRSAFAARQNQLDQAYRLYTLALAGSADLSAMNQLREQASLSAAARWRLAAAYALSGKDNIANDLVDGLDLEVPEYRELSYTYGSTLRDQAMLLETLVLLERDDEAGQLVQDISDQMSSQYWLSTQEMAYALLAVAKFVGDSEVSSTFRINYAVNGTNQQDAGSQRPFLQLDITNQLQNGGNRIAVTNPGSNRLFARLIMEGQPLPGEETGQTNDLQMQVNFLNLDGTPLDPASIPQGRDFQAEVRVTHPGQRPVSYDELALDQVFPSGWEIINTRLDELSGASQSAYEYQDIRDDRVNTFFDLSRGRSHTYRVRLNAAYQGRFYLPGTSCTAMYDNSISAYQAGRWVNVVTQEAGL